MSSSAIYPSFAGDNDKTRYDQAFDRIARCLLSGDNVGFLFGAGMSYTADIPTGQRLASQLLRYMFPKEGHEPPSDKRLLELAGKYPFEALAGAVESTVGGRHDLTKILREALLDPTHEPQQEHRDFVSLCTPDGQRRIRTVFTTNFDILIERELGGFGITVNESNINEIDRFREEGKLAVIHLHGTLDTTTYSITEDDVLKMPSASRVLQAFQSTLYNADAFIFIGYSMNDPEFRWIYREYRSFIKERGNRNKLTYFVSPVADAHAYTLAAAIWEQRDAVFLPFAAAQFFSNLKRLVEGDVSRQVREQILRKYGCVPDDERAFADLVNRTAAALCVDEQEAIRFLQAVRPKHGT